MSELIGLLDQIVLSKGEVVEKVRLNIQVYRYNNRPVEAILAEKFKLLSVEIPGEPLRTALHVQDMEH